VPFTVFYKIIVDSTNLTRKIQIIHSKNTIYLVDNVSIVLLSQALKIRRRKQEIGSHLNTDDSGVP
jgi:hypothetical protein